MTSLAQKLANAKNGQKSRGPVSVEGKRKSSMNAITHGLTAKAILLPDEDPSEFRDMMVGFFESFRPQDQFEVSLVERIACANWRLDRITRAQSARLCLKAKTSVQERKKRERRECNELELRLLRAPHGRVTVLPFTAQAGEEVEAETTTGTFDAADHPSLLLCRLAETETGCATLLHLWSELRTSLENGKRWLGAPERFRLFRLMGIHPVNAYMNTDIASMLQACQVLDPEAGSLVGEVWNELVSAEALAAIEKLYQQEVAHIAGPDQDEARAYLLKLVTGEMNWLDEQIQNHEEQAELEAQLEQPNAGFDDGRDGELMRRYEVSSEKHYRSCRDEIYRWRAEKRRRIASGEGGMYFLPSPRWFDEVSARKSSFDAFQELENEFNRFAEEAVAEGREAEACEERMGPSVGLADGSVPAVQRLDDGEDRAAAAARSERDDRNRPAECVVTASDSDEGAMDGEREQTTLGNQEVVVTAGGNDDARTANEREVSPRGDRAPVRGALGRTVATQESNRDRKRRKRLERERLRQEGRAPAVALAGS